MGVVAERVVLEIGRVRRLGVRRNSRETPSGIAAFVPWRSLTRSSLPLVPRSLALAEPHALTFATEPPLLKLFSCISIRAFGEVGRRCGVRDIGARERKRSKLRIRFALGRRLWRRITVIRRPRHATVSSSATETTVLGTRSAAGRVGLVCAILDGAKSELGRCGLAGRTCVRDLRLGDLLMGKGVRRREPLLPRWWWVVERRERRRSRNLERREGVMEMRMRMGMWTRLRGRIQMRTGILWHGMGWGWSRSVVIAIG